MGAVCLIEVLKGREQVLQSRKKYDKEYHSLSEISESRPYVRADDLQVCRAGRLDRLDSFNKTCERVVWSAFEWI